MMRIGSSVSDLRRRSRRNYFLSDAGDAAIGGEIGGAVGSAVNAVIPIPGIGAIIGEAGGLIGGLFGPSAHYTPSGLTFEEAMEDMHTGYYAMMSLVNQVRATGGLPPAPLLDWVGAGTPTPNYSGNVCDHNAPMVGPYLAKLLANPALASINNCNAIAGAVGNGTYDAAISAENQLVQHLQFTLDSLQSGELVWRGGTIVPAGTAALPPAPPPVGSCAWADSVCGQGWQEISTPAGYPPPPAGLIYVHNPATGVIMQADEQTNTLINPATGQAVQPAAAAPAGAGFSSLTPYAPYLLAGGAVLLLLLLLKKRRGGANVAS
jgi:hypothetical protein